MNGESVAASTLRKDFAETLMAEGLLTVQTNGSRRKFRAIDTEALKNFLQGRYEELKTVGDVIPTLYETRYEQAAETGNSKLVKVRSCPGFPVNSYEPIACSLRGHEFVVSPQEGSFVFIDDWQHFVIPEDVVVVGIENMENFRMIRQQKALFERELQMACSQQQIANFQHQRLLFVSRYPQSTDLRRWLQTVPNRYVHFGDFDLAGIHIFLTEFHPYLGHRASFLIPSDIAQRLSHGSSERYNAQYGKFHGLHCPDKNLQSLIDLINSLRRCYDQEGYIVGNSLKQTE